MARFIQNGVMVAKTDSEKKGRFNMPNANETTQKISKIYTSNIDQFVTIGDIFNPVDEEKKKLQKLLSGIEPNWRAMRAGTVKAACKKFLKENRDDANSSDIEAAYAIRDTMKLTSNDNEPLHINPQVLNNMRFIIEAYGITEESLFVASLCEF